MNKRVLAAVGAGATALAAAVVFAGAAGAQTYPPAPNAITVDDPTPAPGQVVTVTLRTCRPGTLALLGIDLSLLATPRADANGVAAAAVTVPRSIRPGRHVVSGACLDSGWRPLFLTTIITVGTAPGGGVGSGATAVSGGTTGGGGSAGSGRGSAPSLDALAGPSVPADAALLYETTALTNGITGATGDDAGGGGSGSGGADGAAAGGSDPGTLGTIARVTLGLLAVGGVPVAMAIGRRPSAAARSGFAWSPGPT
jgi:hypothetical protein